MKAYQLIYETTYQEYDEGFTYEQTEMMPGTVFLHKEKAEEERRRILLLPYREQEKFTTRFSGYLSDIRIKEWDIVE